MPACQTASFLGAQFRALRKRHGLTQEEAARLTSTDYKYWQLLEAGRKDLRLTTLEKIAATFGLEARQLFAGELPASALTGKTIAPPHRPAKRKPPQSSRRRGKP